MAERREASILHVDLDAFYASVEQLKRPELRGKPIAVGGGVVLAASYEARRFGVRSAMPLRRARSLCPQLIVVEGSFGDYVQLSDQVMDICHRYTPLVEQISIDEAFLDVAKAKRLFGDGAVIARRLRADVREETGLPISAGVATTKFLAKVASRVAKPDGLTVVPPGRELDFLHPLPVEMIWGVGPVTASRLRDMGIETIGELADAPPNTVAGRLGVAVGGQLGALALNRDERSVVQRRRARSVGAQRAFGGDRKDPEFHRTVLMKVCDRVGGRLRAKERAGTTITVRVRFSDMEAVTRSATLRAPVATTEALFAVGETLLAKAIDEAAAGRGLSLIGVSVSNLVDAPHLQMELPLGDEGGGGVAEAGSEISLRKDRLDAAVDEVRRKFGKVSLGAASVLLDAEGRMVPDEFGDLAIPASERRSEDDDTD